MAKLETAVSGLTGHIKLQAPGFADDPSLLRAFSSDTSVSLSEQRSIKGMAQRINLPGVISSERETRGVALVGVIPSQEHISFYHDLEITGDGLTGTDDGRLLIGKALAETLQTQVGRRVVMIVEGADVLLGGGVGAGVRESDPELRDKLTAAIQSMKADGSLNALIEKWEIGVPFE